MNDKALNKCNSINQYSPITFFTLESWDSRVHTSELESEYEVPFSSMDVPL